MFRPDRGTLRSASFVALLSAVFVLVNSQVVYAADSNGESGDLLGPLNIDSSEGVPIDGYELNAQGGSIMAFKTQALAFALSGLFTLIRLLVGLAGWAIEVAFRFPLLKMLTDPAQKVSEVYDDVVVDTLGVKGLLLAWAFVFTGFMLVRGRIGRGVGEMFLTLLIAAFAASAFVRPDFLLAADGPLGQSRQVGLEVARQSVNAYDWGGKLASSSPCATTTGGAEADCYQREAATPASSADIARPLQDSVTNALIVKPYMLLQYGRILDPAKPADRTAYAIHLKWVTGGYTAGDVAVSDRGKEVCSKIRGPAREYCERGFTEGVPSGEDIARETGTDDDLPSLTPGGELLDASKALVTDEDREFDAFLQDLKRAGDVGKACATYAEKPTWWRVGGALLLLVAALFICGMLLSSAIVMLGTQGVCVAAAAAGGIAFVAGMLPGPARQSVWKWLSLWGIAILALVAVCAFVPFFGIAVDVTITDGPDLMIERILLIDVLAIAGAAGHRQLLTGISSFGRRMAMRMRYAKVGGTHLPGDTSELGAALAMNSPAALGGYGGGLRAFTGGGKGRFGMLGTRQRLMGALGSLVDGTGMPVDTGRILSDASAEAGRGLAPLTAAAAVGGLGARLGAKGGHWLLIGKRPDREQLAKWRKPTADGDPHTGGTSDQGPGGAPGGGPAGPGPGPRRPGGPRDRYRDDDGQIIDAATGEVLHDQHADRTLLSTRAHNRLVRLRGYRILHRGGRAAYGATVGLPATVHQAKAAGSRYSRDVRQQVRVWGNTVQQDGRAWSDTARQVSRVLRANTDGPEGSASSGGRRLPAASASAAVRRQSAPQQAPGVDSAARVSGTTATRGGATAVSTPATPPNRLASGDGLNVQGPVLPGGGGARGDVRDQARARMQELMRRTAPEAERLRQERSQQESSGASEDGEQE
ncbi:hypothetical protein GCM10010261_63660 [Streptomyces pilosus]|uniref:hypothetical protein n=1 Tax=Streptomyces pilosus TaxID=28893 RepID=UPI00167A431E|nr:hypothetical protein [Streptomyces pilosus]GGV69260.1 hypothetical protein GCM10010261_63660 [Streptomyces pilosus]